MRYFRELKSKQIRISNNISDVIAFLIDKMNEGYTTVELIDDARAAGWFDLSGEIEFTFDSRPHNSKIVGIEARKK